mgnify:CR=1 FL=1
MNREVGGRGKGEERRGEGRRGEEKVSITIPCLDTKLDWRDKARERFMVT